MSILISSQTQRHPRPQVDPRGLRFSGLLTSVVLAVVILAIPSPAAIALLGLQAVVFALGAVRGASVQPYGIVFRRFVRPRLSRFVPLEDAEPPRFAQFVGLAFALVGLIALLAGAEPVAYLAVGFALAAAFLNAAFGFCLGCEVYLVATRIAARVGAARPTA